jgi:hypothetical protein
MDPTTVPTDVPIALEGACTFAIECWRLGRISILLKDSAEGAGLRHTVRRINETLDAMGIQIVDFAGRAYDPGMVPEVVEVREEPGLPDGHAVVQETIAPTVTWRGQVIKNGQIIVKGTPRRSPEFTKAKE